MIILYAVPISLWPTLSKENRYFYTRHPNNNDRWFSRKTDHCPYLFKFSPDVQQEKTKFLDIIKK